MTRIERRRMRWNDFIACMSKQNRYTKKNLVGNTEGNFPHWNLVVDDKLTLQ
jgi:hypothetical protein